MSDHLKVKVIGVGGIGGCLLPDLCRFLNYDHRFEPIEVTLIDGDSYEPKNATRQAFQNMTNKAQDMADRLREEFPRLNFRVSGVYLTKDNIGQHLRDGDVIFSCVDNHATRKLVSDRCCELDNVVLISGGNDFSDGNVQVHARRDGEDLSRPVADPEYHPEIVAPIDENPGEFVPSKDGCQALVESAPQLLFANAAAAQAMKAVFYGHVEGHLYHAESGQTVYDEVVFDIRSNQAKHFKRKPVSV